MALPERIPLPDLWRLDQKPYLPEWLQQRIDALSSEVQADRTSRHRPTWVLPRSMILDCSRRKIVEAHISDLERLLDLRQPFRIRGQTLSNEGALGLMIAQLLLKGGAKLDAISADALTEDYFDALEDMPAGAVRATLRKWNRAQSLKLDGKPHDFNYRPTPPTLRRLAEIELASVRGRILLLQRVLSAVPKEEFDEKHCEEMRKRFGELGNFLRAL